jgi:arylsulfatase A-like enzyme
MIRQEQFKVIHYPAAKKFLMFNIEKDPHEMNDLSGSKEVAYVYERLKQQLSTYLKANNAKQIVAKMPKKAKGKKH